MTGDLRASNRRVLAERLHWPVGAVEACEDLERRFPGWHVDWTSENTIRGFERPAGFWATFDNFHHVEILRADPDELAEVMVTVQTEHDYSIRGCDWCIAHPRAVSWRRVQL